jgi:hypothetical protein
VGLALTDLPPALLPVQQLKTLHIRQEICWFNQQIEHLWPAGCSPEL